MKPNSAIRAAVIALAPFLSLFVVSSITVASVGEPEENVHLVPATEPPGAWTLQWTGRTGRTYFVQHSHDLHSWTYLNTIKHGEGAKMLGTSSTGNRYFLRLRHTDIPCVDPATADFDGDGLNNADELFWLCGPFLADSDGDGFNDGWEINVGWDPKQNNANQAHLDPDGDGWDNATEHLYGTNPNLADSDEDGLDDPDDADPNDLTIDWPRAPEATRIWIPLIGYDPSTHGAPVALSNTGIALFEKAIWKGGVWKMLEWEREGPGLTYPDGPNGPEVLSTTLRAIRPIDLADDGRVVGTGELLFDDPHGGGLGAPGTISFAVQWTQQGENMVMEMTGGNTSGGLDLETYLHWPQAEGLSPDGVLFTLFEPLNGADQYQWGRHGPTAWKDAPNPTFVRSGWEDGPNYYDGGVFVPARNTVKGGRMGVWNVFSGTSRLLSADGESPLPTGPGYVCGSLADNRVAFNSFSSGPSVPCLRPLGNIGTWRPVPKLAGTAAFNARGEAISQDGRFWQNGKWLSPVSEGNTPPTGTMHLHDLNDHGVMLATAGEDAGNSQSGPQYGNQAGIISPIRLLADTNRDGQINQRDEEGKGEFTRKRGAFFNVNFDNDNPGKGAGTDADPDAITWWMGATGPDKENWEIENEADVADTTPFQVSLPKLPEGSRVYLRVGHQEQRMAAHFFYKREAGQKAFWGGVTTPPPTVWTDGDADPLDIEITEGVLGSLASPEEDGHFEFGLEGLVLRGMPMPGDVGTLRGVPLPGDVGSSGIGCFGGLITLNLEVAIPGQEERLVSAPITLRVAPWLLIPNTQSAEAVFVAGIDHDNDPTTNLQAALAIPGATTVASGNNQWLQDHAEIGYTQRPGAEPMFLTFGTPYSIDAQGEPIPVNWIKETLLGPNHGIFHLMNLPNADGENHGGNIEVLPPTDPPKADEPLGAIVVGHGEKHKMSNALLHFLGAQEFQPVKLLNVDFASVHHIDEVLSVGAKGEIYYNDPKMALDLLREKFPETSGTTRLQGCFFDDLGKGRGEARSLGYNVGATTVNYNFLIPVDAHDQAFATRFANGTVRIVGKSRSLGPAQPAPINPYSLANSHWGQVAEIADIVAITGSTIPTNYTGEVVGKSRVNVGDVWQPILTWQTTQRNWFNQAFLPLTSSMVHPLSGEDYLVESTRKNTWHHISPEGSDLIFIEGKSLFWRNELFNVVTHKEPALVCVREILDDLAFVNFNENDIRSRIQGVTAQLNGRSLVALPALFLKRTKRINGAVHYYADAFTPNPVNMQWVNGKAWIAKQYSPSTGETDGEDIFAAKITAIMQDNAATVGFIDDWEDFHVRKGEVHCGTLVRRVPSSNWWDKLK